MFFGYSSPSLREIKIYSNYKTSPPKDGKIQGQNVTVLRSLKTQAQEQSRQAWVISPLTLSLISDLERARQQHWDRAIQHGLLACSPSAAEIDLREEEAEDRFSPKSP